MQKDIRRGDKFWFKYLLSASAATVAETGDHISILTYICYCEWSIFCVDMLYHPHKWQIDLVYKMWWVFSLRLQNKSSQQVSFRWIETSSCLQIYFQRAYLCNINKGMYSVAVTPLSSLYFSITLLHRKHHSVSVSLGKEILHDNGI